MWSFDPASPEYNRAVAFLKSYSAPEPRIIQHPKPIVDIISTETSSVELALLREWYYSQEKLTENAVIIYNQAVENWKLNVAQDPYLPLPPIPDLPAVIPPLAELRFGTLSIDAPLVVTNPALALRLLRSARVVPGNPNEYVPFPRVDPQPPDDRVIAEECPGAPGYFRPGPADQFPNRYVYTLDGRSYIKFASPFGAVWMLLAN